jgi:hypothetical protein
MHTPLRSSLSASCASPVDPRLPRLLRRALAYFGGHRNGGEQVNRSRRASLSAAPMSVLTHGTPRIDSDRPAVRRSDRVLLRPLTRQLLSLLLLCDASGVSRKLTRASCLACTKRQSGPRTIREESATLPAALCTRAMLLRCLRSAGTLPGEDGSLSPVFELQAAVLLRRRLQTNMVAGAGFEPATFGL